MADLKDANEIIDALGGTGATARLTGRRYDQAVSNWRSSGRLPADTYLVISNELKKLGLHASPSLWGITEAAHD